MEATTDKPDDLCIAIAMLKSHITHLESKSDPMLDYSIRTLKRTLRSVENVNDGLKRAYVHAPTAAEAATLRAILHP